MRVNHTYAKSQMAQFHLWPALCVFFATVSGAPCSALAPIRQERCQCEPMNATPNSTSLYSTPTQAMHHCFAKLDPKPGLKGDIVQLVDCSWLFAFGRHFHERCAETDHGVSDIFGYDCDGYLWYPSWCGDYDDADFSSENMCCACGGGAYYDRCEETDNGASDSHDDGCDNYAGNPIWCGGYDDLDFSSESMCCACGGGERPYNDLWDATCLDFMGCLNDPSVFDYDAFLDVNLPVKPGGDPTNKTLQQVYDSFLEASIWVNPVLPEDRVENPLDEAGCFHPADLEEKMARSEFVLCQCTDQMLVYCGTNQGCIRWMMCANKIQNMDICSSWIWGACGDYYEKPCDPVANFSSCDWGDWSYWGDRVEAEQFGVIPKLKRVEAEQQEGVHRRTPPAILQRSRSQSARIASRQSVNNIQVDISQDASQSLEQRRKQRNERAILEMDETIGGKLEC